MNPEIVVDANSQLPQAALAAVAITPRCLCLDIETRRADRLALKEIGAFRPDSGQRLRISGKDRALAAKLDAISEGADFVLGHNIVAFDVPALADLFPQLRLHALPLIDTLLLSPIAFPQNPYHRLVKDYKLVSTARSDPVADAELSFTLFGEQCAALAQRQSEHPEEMLCLHHLLAAGKGFGQLFAKLRGSPRPPVAAARAAFVRCVEDKVCRSALARVLARDFAAVTMALPLAYVLVWLRVAGGNSVLPPWVSKEFPATAELLRELRDTPCADPDCAWCRENHDLGRQLALYFPGIDRFRPNPTTADGRSLQEAIVRNGYARRPTLAILPTGGGKSLCYQLPALSRFYRTGALTVVVSPLQSLMKDQVDNLLQRGVNSAGFLNGLLAPLERKEMLDRLRLGDLGIVFVAPEQFRSPAFANALRHREVAAWVFDEAHCFSKWGHDFRPDYLYVSRFIRRRYRDVPPVFAFTATAKPDVVADIVTHFRERLGIEFEVRAGGVARDNLAYEVIAVAAQQKFARALQLIEDSLGEPGGVIIFCARQKATEEFASFLREAGIEAAHFHGGIDPDEKRRVQESFIRGELRVIAATNAFGMGVDKPDVRLVIHLDTPGSLENYLQEAGRAGRDQALARCVLLYDESDLDFQFRLLRDSRLSQRDIRAILKALRQIERKSRGDGEVVATTGEILLELPDDAGFDSAARDADTKVRVAIAWLEEAQLLWRMENETRVFPGALKVAGIEAAQEKLLRHGVAEPDFHLRLLSALLQVREDESVTTDELMQATGADSATVQKMLRELDDAGILANDQEIAVVLFAGKDPSAARCERLRRIEPELIELMREHAPDAVPGEWQEVHLRRLCHELRERSGAGIEPAGLRRLLKALALPFGEGQQLRSLIDLAPAGPERLRLRLSRDWKTIETIARRRIDVAAAALSFFEARRKGNETLVVVRQNELRDALAADITLASHDIRDWVVAIGAVLMHLHHCEVLSVARGKGVFRPAMSLHFNPDAARRQFSRGDYAGLELHYHDRIVQVHVMAEYARLALEKVQAALGFVGDYFSLPRDEFIARHFAGRKEVLELATSDSAYRRILTDLKHPAQQEIVAAPTQRSQLVLAGPGSGKTRVLVHRIAWLVRVQQVPPAQILVLAFNRSAVVEVRRRLWALIGEDAARLSVQTLHGFSLRLLGISFALLAERGEEPDFAGLFGRATELLNNDEGAGRDRQLAGITHILIDEYQDLDADAYALVSAIAGRTQADAEDRLSIFAVGDDDQNIYAFGGAEVGYIRRFESDYAASRFLLLDNFRSTRNIIDAANALIVRAPKRLKAGSEPRIDPLRREQPPGGRLDASDPRRGRVVVLEVPADLRSEALLALEELQRLRQTDREFAWGRCAVIARQWQQLEALAAACRLAGIPVRVGQQEAGCRLHQTREGRGLLELLRRHRRPLLRARTLSRWLRRRHATQRLDEIDNPWLAALARFIAELEAAGDFQRVVADVIESFHEFREEAAHDDASGPLRLLTAHAAKGLEFDHVVILDGGGWSKRLDDERRLYYVAMTRARASLTLCERVRGRHAFIPDLGALPLRIRPPEPESEQQRDPRLDRRSMVAGAGQVYLSWAAHFPADAPLHAALAGLSVGDPLLLRQCSFNPARWELATRAGIAVTRMAKAFRPPAGEILSVSVAAILVRDEKQEKLPDPRRKLGRWELVLPRIDYQPPA
ncbi:RecQ family ATP-dependent DNA helicase [Rhodocyclus purpureus]|uniref:RecQ family ATP-dependent DNA helicase n=1 Tax=Rhodocyclus purpureus TaxID=1067 RepID=UPI001912A070|nr:RecQ family ATP-dependent DNA helicase [Rhodocyclus purpureus]MBK5914249.1 recombinase RecQ [Rhodocyclus purpureus]